MADNRRPNLLDVARESGYSYYTVCAAFNPALVARSKKAVSAQTGADIMQAAERIGYFPKAQEGLWDSLKTYQPGVTP